MEKDTTIWLCDVTGIASQPWREAGYHAILVDPQHQKGVWTDGLTTRIGAKIEDCLSYIGGVIRSGRVAFVGGFPPCTDVAVSGSRWFEAKRQKDPYFQAKASIVAEQCRMIGELSGAAWYWENPVSVFTQIFGKPDYTFHPHHYTQYCAKDNYTKLTTLRTGGGFVMPPKAKDHALGEPDDRIHKAPPSDERANFRSATPLGFSKAVFLANAPHLREKMVA